MNNPDYEKAKTECWEELWNDLIKDRSPVDFPTAGDVFEYVFSKAYALGKQEKDAESVIQGWVARDKNGLLSLFRLYRPERGYDYNGEFGEWGTSIGYQMTIPNRLFHDLTWDSDPIEVELIIKRKKK